jgi:2-dehydro-3-deoxyphosphooctonate aldolase (KDO 8-P synthase)
VSAEFVETLSRAAVAVGVAGLFHRDPRGSRQLAVIRWSEHDPAGEMPRLLETLMAFDAVAKR